MLEYQWLIQNRIKPNKSSCLRQTEVSNKHHGIKHSVLSIFNPNISFSRLRLRFYHLSYKLLNLSISHSCREIAFCPVGVFLSHPAYNIHLFLINADIYETRVLLSALFSCYSVYLSIIPDAAKSVYGQIWSVNTTRCLVKKYRLYILQLWWKLRTTLKSNVQTNVEFRFCLPDNSDRPRQNRNTCL